MEHIFEWRPLNQSQPPRAESGIQNDVVMILKKLPQGEEDWADGGPQSDEGIAALFGKLTLNDQLTPETRLQMSCEDLLETFAREMKPECQLHIMTLAGACNVAIRHSLFRPETAREIMRIGVDKSKASLDALRFATLKLSRILDEMHIRGIVADRTYELPIYRHKWLMKLAIFTDRHFQFFREYITSADIYKPKKPVSSTCLRPCNVIYSLFAGKFSREDVENAFQLPEQPVLRECWFRESKPFATLLTLAEEHAEDRRAASREVVGLAPTLQNSNLGEDGLLDPFPKLGGFIRTQGPLISSVAESKGLRIVDFQSAKLRVVRINRQTPIATLPNRLAVFVLLQDNGVDMTINKDGGEMRWEPYQILCYFGDGVYPKDERERLFCLMALLEVKRN